MLYEVPGGNLVDGLPPAASNATREEGRALGPNIYVAEQVFKRDVLAIHLSDLYKNLVEPTLDSKD